MAYMNQEKKARIAENLNPILKKYGVKGSLSVEDNLAIVLTMTSGPIDFIGDLTDVTADGKDRMRKHYEITVSIYGYQQHFSGESLTFLSEIFPVLTSEGWYRKIDDVAYYINVNVGKSEKKPYTLTK
jgi:hypothetical protein